MFMRIETIDISGLYVEPECLIEEYYLDYTLLISEPCIVAFLVGWSTAADK